MFLNTRDVALSRVSKFRIHLISQYMLHGFIVFWDHRKIIKYEIQQAPPPPKVEKFTANVH